MQPLKILTNVQKARLLHALLYNEMPQFVAFLTARTEMVLNNEDKVRTEWKDNFFSADLWLSLAKETDTRLKRYGIDIQRSSPVFAEQLFDGYGALYTVQQLIAYTANESTEPKFKQAVELLFI